MRVKINKLLKFQTFKLNPTKMTIPYYHKHQNRTQRFIQSTVLNSIWLWLLWTTRLGRTGTLHGYVFARRRGETDGRRVPVADMRVLGVHHDLGADVTGHAGRQLPGDDRVAVAVHRLVQHAGAVRDRRAQEARVQQHAGADAPRVLGRRAPPGRAPSLLRVRAHVRRDNPGGRHGHVRGAGRVGGQPRQHRLAGRVHIRHVVAVAAAHARQVRRHVRRPVHRLNVRVGQHRRHGAGHGARGRRDAGAGGHARARGRPLARATRVRPRRSARLDGRARATGRRHAPRSRRVRQTPSDAHQASAPLPRPGTA